MGLILTADATTVTVTSTVTAPYIGLLLEIKGHRPWHKGFPWCYDNRSGGEGYEHLFHDASVPLGVVLAPPTLLALRHTTITGS